VTYAGATSKLDPSDLARLTSHGFQVKHDGAYCVISTDAAGRIVRLTSRSGKEHDRSDCADLLGLPTGLPDSAIVGELEAQTERSIAARSARGYPLVHLFDIATWRGCPVAGEPYRTRNSLLHRWQAMAELGEVPRVDWWRTDRQGMAHDDRGRYVRPVPRDLRRLPITRTVYGQSAARELLDQVAAADGEGIVAVRLDAPMGARSAKVKLKFSDALDCVVIAAQGGVAYVEHRRGKFTVAAGSKALAGLTTGCIVEVTHEGWYQSGLPRFPRIVRVRSDLPGMLAS